MLAFELRGEDCFVPFDFAIGSVDANETSFVCLGVACDCEDGVTPHDG